MSGNSILGLFQNKNTHSESSNAEDLGNIYHSTYEFNNPSSTSYSSSSLNRIIAQDSEFEDYNDYSDSKRLKRGDLSSDYNSSADAYNFEDEIIHALLPDTNKSNNSRSSAEAYDDSRTCYDDLVLTESNIKNSAEAISLPVKVRSKKQVFITIAIEAIKTIQNNDTLKKEHPLLHKDFRTFLQSTSVPVFNRICKNLTVLLIECDLSWGDLSKTFACASDNILENFLLHKDIFKSFSSRPSAKKKILDIIKSHPRQRNLKKCFKTKIDNDIKDFIEKVVITAYKGKNKSVFEATLNENTSEIHNTTDPDLILNKNNIIESLDTYLSQPKNNKKMSTEMTDEKKQLTIQTGKKIIDTIEQDDFLKKNRQFLQRHFWASIEKINKKYSSFLRILNEHLSELLKDADLSWDELIDTFREITKYTLATLNNNIDDFKSLSSRLNPASKQILLLCIKHSSAQFDRVEYYMQKPGNEELKSFIKKFMFDGSRFNKFAESNKDKADYLKSNLSISNLLKIKVNYETYKIIADISIINDDSDFITKLNEHFKTNIQLNENNNNTELVANLKALLTYLCKSFTNAPLTSFTMHQTADLHNHTVNSSSTISNDFDINQNLKSTNSFTPMYEKTLNDIELDPSIAIPSLPPDDYLNIFSNNTSSLTSQSSKQPAKYTS